MLTLCKLNDMTRFLLATIILFLSASCGGGGGGGGEKSSAEPEINAEYMNEKSPAVPEVNAEYMKWYGVKLSELFQKNPSISYLGACGHGRGDAYAEYYGISPSADVNFLLPFTNGYGLRNDDEENMDLYGDLRITGLEGIAGVLFPTITKAIPFADIEELFGAPLLRIDDDWSQPFNIISCSDYKIFFTNWSIVQPEHLTPDMRIVVAPKHPIEGFHEDDTWRIMLEALGMDDDTFAQLIAELYLKLPDSVMPDYLKTEEQRKTLAKKEGNGKYFDWSEKSRDQFFNCFEISDNVPNAEMNQRWRWFMAAYQTTIIDNSVVLLIRYHQERSGSAWGEIKHELIYNTHTERFTDYPHPIDDTVIQELVNSIDCGNEKINAAAKEDFYTSEWKGYFALNYHFDRHGFSISIFMRNYLFDRFTEEEYETFEGAKVSYKWDGSRFLRIEN
jgi:hypothetical protein